MLSFGIKNLRRIEQDEPIQIRPITILVGRNSSGKSTFLRSLPLLRQSLMTRTSSPILWYGDWVDFGDFERAVKDNDVDLPITFMFGTNQAYSPPGFYYSVDQLLLRSDETKLANVRLDVSIVKHETGTRLSKVFFSNSTNETEIKISFSEDSTVNSVIIDGVETLNFAGDWSLEATTGSIFPSLRWTIKGSRSSASGRMTSKEIVPPEAAYLSHPARLTLEDIIRPHLDKRMKRETLFSLTAPLFSLVKFDRNSLRVASKQSQNRSWQKLIEEVTGNDKRGLYEEIRRLLLLHSLPMHLEIVKRSLESSIQSILYIGPARAKSDRYYRYQDLSVSEIDPDGKNFPMFLNSLSDRQMRSFSDWVKEKFGYGVQVQRESGHITINLVYDDREVNVVDTGYGVSQILPVLGQIWWANERARARSNINSSGKHAILAIEQPELHLHPAHQALLADAFVSGYLTHGQKDPERGTHFLLETHSEALVNRLGELIFNKVIRAEDVHILIFDSDEDSPSESSVNIATFDENGELVNWPYQFFLPV